MEYQFSDKIKGIMKTGCSVITNFGCDAGCKYCIWNQHPLKNCFTTLENTNWDKLKEFVVPYEKISISGGGDPFYKYDLNIKWFDKLFNLYNGKVDVHTSKILSNKHLERFNRIVVHFTYNRFLENKQMFYNLRSPKRAVFVLTKDLTVDKIQNIIYELNYKNCQLSFRELYNGKIRQNISKYLKDDKLKWVKFIKQADYNIYYMPNNKVYTSFMGENYER